MSSIDPQEFASAVLAAFRQAGRFTDQEVVDAGGPSTTTLTRLRKVADGQESMDIPRGDTLRRIDAAADWPAGSARLLWTQQITPPRRPAPLGGGRVFSDDATFDLATRLTALERRVAALEARGGDGHADDPGGAAPMKADDYELAADDGDGLTIEEEQGHDEHP